MRASLLSRIPRETKVAAAVLAMALLQIGVLAALGLAGAERTLDDAERDAADRAAGAAATLSGFAAERVGSHESDAADEVGRTDLSAARRAEEALRRAPLFRAAYLVGADGSIRDSRRPPHDPPPRSLFDEAARRRLDETLRLEETDPAAAAALAATVAEGIDAGGASDSVAAALTLQSGARAARAAGDPTRAAALARRVITRFRAVRDDRGAQGEREPLGLSSSALLCDVLFSSLANGSDAEHAAFVDAVVDRRIDAQRFVGAASSAALRIESAECTALARGAAWLSGAARRRLDESLAACDEIDRGLARVSAVAPKLAAVAASREAARIGLADGALVVVVPAPSAGPWSAVAFLAERRDLLDAAVRPAAVRADAPPGTTMTVRDESGAVVAGTDPASAQPSGAADRDAGRVLATAELGKAFPGLRAAVTVTDPEALAAGIRDSRRYWLFVLAGSALAVAAASVLAVRAVLREVRLARMKSDFVSNLSHELRTPLTSMRMFVETLQEGRVTDEAERKECIDIIAHETNRLSSLVDRVLTFASFAKGRAPIEASEGDVADAVGRAVALFRKRAEAAGTRLEVRNGEGVPPVRQDRDAVVQVILNLLDNAVKHAGHDGARVRVTVAASDGGAAVTVDDDGPGVPERERELVFEEFYRGDDTLSRRTQGAGIGLALCRRIVLAHGGTVRVGRSADLGGASFRVWLPAAGRTGSGAAARAARDAEASS